MFLSVGVSGGLSKFSKIEQIYPVNHNASFLCHDYDSWYEVHLRSYKLSIHLQSGVNDTVPLSAYKIDGSLLLTAKRFIQVRQNWFRVKMNGSLSIIVSGVTLYNWAINMLYMIHFSILIIRTMIAASPQQPMVLRVVETDRARKFKLSWQPASIDTLINILNSWNSTLTSVFFMKIRTLTGNLLPLQTLRNCHKNAHLTFARFQLYCIYWSTFRCVISRMPQQVASTSFSSSHICIWCWTET